MASAPTTSTNATTASPQHINIESHTSTSGSVTATCSVVNFGSSSHSTGICFLDHMVDQLTSHGQIGVTLRVSVDGTPHLPHVDYAEGSLTERPHDEDIFGACGAALGKALRALVTIVQSSSSSSSSEVAEVNDEGSKGSSAVFCCPLDEAFAEASLCLFPSSSDTAKSECVCDLAPYGTYPLSGRRWIGCYRCALTPLFFQNLTSNLGANLRLRKVRGQNAHHIVESSFKSFARAFRACLDRIEYGGNHGCVTPDEDRVLLRRNNPNLSVADYVLKRRTASRSRSTKETAIGVSVDLDSPPPSLSLSESVENDDTLSTGVELLDLLLSEIRRSSGFRFDVHCKGDVYIDDHHTVEDVSITLGQCLNVALGNKAGLARMGCAEATGEAATVRCVVDLSNRPHFEWDLPLEKDEYVGGDGEAFSAMERAGRKVGKKAVCGAALTCEMLQHAFESLATETRATVHLEVVGKGGDGDTKDLAVASARALGKALAECVRVDPRRAGKVASSKGTLSV